MMGFKEKPELEVKPTSVDWNDFVLSKFSDDEIFEDELGNKYPKISGLRRVTELLMGEIKESGTESVNVELFGDKESLGRAHCVYRIILDSGKVFKGWASAGPKNIKGGYSVFPETIAETRAEARALRKILMLKNCSAEELQETDNVDGLEKGDISETQKAFIKQKCETLGVDLNKFAKDLDYLNKEDAQKKIKQLDVYQRNLDSIPQDIKKE